MEQIPGSFDMFDTGLDVGFFLGSIYPTAEVVGNSSPVSICLGSRSPKSLSSGIGRSSEKMKIFIDPEEWYNFDHVGAFAKKKLFVLYFTLKFF